MSQRVFWNFKDDDLTFDLSVWLTSVLNPGVYRGFDFTPTFGMVLTLAHNVSGVSVIKKDGSVSEPLGIIVTRQGCVIQEDADINLTLDPADSTHPRYDTLIVSHSYDDTVVGGNPAIYSVIKGTASATPTIPSLPDPTTDISIGVIYIPAGTVNINDDGVIFRPVFPPANPGGAKTKVLAADIDFDLIGSDGNFYTLSNVNAPTTNTEWHVRVMANNSSNCVQEAYLLNTNKKWMRTKRLGVWSPWIKLLDEDDYAGLSGSGGIGSKVDKLTASTDANNFTVSGHAFWGAATPNAPNSSDSFEVISTFSDTSNGFQLAKALTTGVLYERKKIGTAWGNWNIITRQTTTTDAWDNLVENGFYIKTNNSGAGNSPNPAQGYAIVMVTSTTGTVIQVAFNVTTPLLYYRVRYLGTWTAWTTGLTTAHYTTLQDAINAVQSNLDDLTDVVDSIDGALGALQTAVGELATNKADKTQNAFTNFTLINGATTPGGGAAAPGYVKETTNFVSCRGEVRATGSTSEVVFAVLPVGFRPGQHKYFYGTPAGYNGFIHVNPNGNISLFCIGSSENSMDLDCVRFLVGQ